LVINILINIKFFLHTFWLILLVLEKNPKIQDRKWISWVSFTKKHILFNFFDTIYLLMSLIYMHAKTEKLFWKINDARNLVFSKISQKNSILLNFIKQ